jgi:ketosteroid isomerase-like protein
VWRAVRLAVEALNRRDLDALTVGFHPDFELHPPRDQVEAGFAEARYSGDAGYREWFSASTEFWGADSRFEPVELIDLGQRLVVLYDVHTRGQASGVPLTWKYANVATLKHGRVVRDDGYFDHADALKAVGLQE